MADPKSQTAVKPWAANRLGDPRQLLHEAAQLERTAEDRRREAKRLRAIAKAEEDAAERIDEAARDYRQWVKERETA